MSILNLLTEVPLSAVLREKISGLESDNDALRLENESLKVQLSQSEEQRRALEKQIIESIHLNSLVFDKTTGVWADETKSLHYCPKCKCADGNLSPMKEEQHGWRCYVCNTDYADPARPQQRSPRNPPDWRS